jgi:hypothetical protein
VTENSGTDPLVAGVQKAALHFSKAAIEVVSGVGDLVTGVTRKVRPDSGKDGPTPDGPQKIEIE